MIRSVGGSVLGMMLLLALLFGCEDPRIKSAERAKAHVAALSKAATADVADVRSGMPEGAKRLVKIFATEGGLPDDAAALKKALRLTRGRVQDLRVAKSTFFALVNADGVAMRSNQPVDELSGKSVLKGFPELKTALAGRYIETTGSMNALRGVNTKPDGQWMSAHPVKKDGEVLVPGDIEHRTRQQRMSEGIELDDLTWSQITETARDVGVSDEWIQETLTR